MNTHIFANCEPKWYAIHTRSRFEKIVHTELERNGIEAYLPVVDEVHQWKDRKKAVQQPIFSGYVFARFAMGPARQLHIVRTTGVVRILGDSGGIISIPEREIEAVRRLVETARSYPFPFLREGMKVRVRDGPLKGVTGLLARIKNSTRLVVSIELLSQSVATEIDAQDVEVIQ